MERMDLVHGQCKPFPTRVICSQFANGYCRFGTRCHFLHERPVLPSTIPCRYFQKGGCWYGENCRFLHVPPSYSSAAVLGRRGSAADAHPSRHINSLQERRGSEPALPLVQAVTSQGNSGSWSVVTSQGNSGSWPVTNVSTSHHAIGQLTTADSQEVNSQRPRLSQIEVETKCTSRETVHHQEAAEAGTSDGSKRVPSKTADHGGAAAASADRGQAFHRSKDVTCGICMDKVYEKINAHERRFGILPNCNHSFCLGCVVTWRKTKSFEEEVVKSCPECRVKSTFYVPSDHWVEGQEKQILIAAFKEESNKRICGYYMRNGHCPFNSECIYSHVGHPQRRREHQGPSYGPEAPSNVSDGFRLMDYVIALTLLGGLSEGDDDVDSDDDDDDVDDEDFLWFLMSLHND